jgi:DNA replication protein DnaC
MYGACRQNLKVLFRTAAGLLNELVKAKRQSNVSPFMKQIKKVDLLIIDELGYITFDLEEQNCSFNYLLHDTKR